MQKVVFGVRGRVFMDYASIILSMMTTKSIRA